MLAIFTTTVSKSMLMFALSALAMLIKLVRYFIWSLKYYYAIFENIFCKSLNINILSAHKWSSSSSNTFSRLTREFLILVKIQFFGRWEQIRRFFNLTNHLKWPDKNILNKNLNMIWMVTETRKKIQLTNTSHMNFLHPWVNDSLAIGGCFIGVIV